MKKISIVFCLLVAVIFGCNSSPTVISKTELKEITDKQMPLSGFHRDYIGSDSQYHYIKIGTAVGEREYRIKKTEILVSGEYDYSPTNPRIEPLLPKIKE